PRRPRTAAPRRAPRNGSDALPPRRRSAHRARAIRPPRRGDALDRHGRAPRAAQRYGHGHPGASRDPRPGPGRAVRGRRSGARSRDAWGTAAGAASRRTSTGTAPSATCGRSKPKRWGLPPPERHSPPRVQFPSARGGIARWMGELALRYPPGRLVVSTGRHAGSADSDPRFPQPIDHAPIRATRLRTLNGLLIWTARAAALERRARPGFVWCAELKPAAYPARWLRARRAVPYGVIVHGTELLLLQAKMRRSRWRRWTARQLLGNAAVVVANSRWTADLARSV